MPKKYIATDNSDFLCGGVMLVHVGCRYEIFGFLGKVFRFGQYGLYAFFILSGYFAATWDGNDRKRYIKKKIVRLVPVYYILLAIYILLHTFILDDVPYDAYGLGWFRFITGLNSLLPSEIIFWKGIHAIWYVSVVWIFYLMHALLWDKVKKFCIRFWIILFFVLSIISVTIGRIDPLYSVNILAFMQYFVLGIIAQKYVKKDLYLIVLILTPLIVYLLKDLWLSKNIIFSVLFMVIIISIKNKCVTCPNKLVQVICDTLDEHTYTLFLVHPFFVDFFGAYTMKTAIPKCQQLVIFFILMIASVVIVRNAEAKVQNAMVKRMGLD